jgi:hypothetical protein
VRLNYYLKKRDILFARMSLMVRRKILLAMSVFSVGIFTYSLSTGPEFRGQPFLDRLVFAGFVLVFTVVLYVAVLLGLNLLVLLTSKNIGQVGWHTLEIKDDGLEECTEVNKSLHRWNSSFKILEFGNYLWIYPTDDRFFLIPKRAGGYEGNLAEFVALLRTKIGK